MPVLCFLMLTCNKSNSTDSPKDKNQLSIISTHLLALSEPSGLAINATGTVLWTVTNDPERIYKLDIKGNPIDTLNYRGDDLEGIAYDPSDTTLWVVEEKRREIVHLDINGNILLRQKINLGGPLNSGPEGICLDAAGNIYVLNEKEPGLFLELNTDLSIKKMYPLSFADDYSGLAYNREKNCFWIISDQDESLYLWSREKGVLEEYSLPFSKAEGIAFNEAEKRLYIVSESLKKLYVFQTN